MKTIIIPSTTEMIFQEIDLFDGVILGIKDFSVNLPIYFTLEEIEKIIPHLTKHHKEIFISLNKNLHNQDIEKIKTILLKVEQYHITGILYYDIGIVNLKEKLQLKTPLVWAQEHLTTNAQTCNYWKQFGAPYTYLSSELTLEEIKNIRKKTNNYLLVNILGYLPMFHSKRHLVKNYLHHFNLETEEKDQFYIEKEGKNYPIIDDDLGTTVYSNVVINGVQESLLLKEYGIDYAVLNSYHINPNIFHQILEAYQSLTEENQEPIKRIDYLLKNQFDKGFLYKETVYKVKGGKS